jgi:formylglycine-generating enzyme required for sulfatase activity
MFTRFLQIFSRAGVAMDPVELVEALWLAQFKIAVEPEAAREISPDDPAEAGDSPAPKPRDEVPSMTEDEARVRVYAQSAIGAATGGTPASPALLPGAPPIPNAAAIGRALRPLARRRRAVHKQVFDEELTTQASAECGLITPVFSPAPERWFSVALVAEESAAMAIWRQTVTEFAEVFARHGGFNEVSEWRLRFSDDSACLVSTSSSIQPLARLSRLGERQLIVLITDGASSRWRDGRMARILNQWGARSHVVIAQMLGEWMWPHTALGAPSLLVNSHAPGSPNRDLSAAPRWPDQTRRRNGASAPFPVISLDPDLILEWARMLMQPGMLYTAVALPKPEASSHAARPVEKQKQSTPSKTSGTSAEDRVRNFRHLVSEDAYKLAVYLSWMPLTLPVMRVVQAAMLTRALPETLAEVLLGGVIKRSDPGAPVNNPDDLRFEFYEGVRPLLRGRLLRNEIPELDRCIEDYLTRVTGRRFNFTALLPDPKGDLVLPVEAGEFVRLRREALEQLGLLHIFDPPPESEDQVVDEESSLPLSTFDFETVTLDETGREITRRKLSARQFIEDLDGVLLEMVEIPGGKFMMGSPENEAERFADEGPQREVAVPSFYIGKFTVTQAQWRIVAGWEKVERELKPYPSNFKGEDRPVENVNWEDAREFCARLARKTGRLYRLPSEAEWEYACRAGTNTPFAFGETITPEIVNYDGNFPYAKAKKGKYRKETVPVGSLGVANASGLFDMHGNVWEWCEDAWHENYNGAPTNGSTWLSGENSSIRVLRGGSFNHLGRYCRSAFRNDNDARLINVNVGFRVVVSARTS